MLGIIGFLGGCKKNEDQQPINYIKIAGLLPQTGGLSSLASTSRAALEIGVDRINDDFNARGLPYRIALSVFDTRLDTLEAKSLIQSLAADGFQMFVGPMSSAELLAIKPFADSAGLIVVSPSSTSATLSMPDDAIFRFCPGERIVCNALANTTYSAGKRAMLTFSRNDVATLGLQTNFTSSFTALGGTVVSAGSYPVNTTDFTSTINDVRAGILSLSTSYNRNEIGVYYPSFNEAILFFHQAATDSVLSSVNWYGGVGFIKAPGLLVDTPAAAFAYTTHYFSPEPALPNATQSDWSSLKAAIQSRCGIEPDFYAFASYDALMVMAQLIEQKNGFLSNGPGLQQDFYTLCNQSTGTTGPITLDVSGDRSSGVFNYWGLGLDSSGYYWTNFGQSQ